MLHVNYPKKNELFLIRNLLNIYMNTSIHLYNNPEESLEGYAFAFVMVALVLGVALYDYNVNLQKRKEIEKRKESFNKTFESFLARRIRKSTGLSSDQSDKCASTISKTIDSNPSEVACFLFLGTILANMR